MFIARNIKTTETEPKTTEKKNQRILLFNAVDIK